MSFKKSILNFLNYYYNKWQFRAFLFAGAVLNILAVVLFVQFLSNQLIDREESMIRTSATIYKSIAGNINNPAFNSNELFDILDEINSDITFPVITTNENDEPNYPYKSNSLNVEIDSNLSDYDQKRIMLDLLNKMKAEYEPVVVTTNSGEVLTKLYYTHSSLIDYLRFFPVLALIVIIGLTISAYIIFNNIRDNQEKMVWVGMSKEAAHQLGTPLSSMLAWLEILKMQGEGNDKIESTISEMENDVDRLSIIANRFSKIGSKPVLKEKDLTELINESKNYFELRLPHLGKKVRIEDSFNGKTIKANINSELFAWVIENLIKNAAEAIEKKDGLIRIDVSEKQDCVELLISDNGKGMVSSLRKQVFLPGVTTKKRGWGLGLTLCKRIIEQYHKGKIYVKESHLGKGTTFAIELPIRNGVNV